MAIVEDCILTQHLLLSFLGDLLNATISFRTLYKIYLTSSRLKASQSLDYRISHVQHNTI